MAHFTLYLSLFTMHPMWGHSTSFYLLFTIVTLYRYERTFWFMQGQIFFHKFFLTTFLMTRAMNQRVLTKLLMIQNLMIAEYFITAVFTIPAHKVQLIKHISDDLVGSISEFRFLTAFEWAYMSSTAKPFIEARTTETSFTNLAFLWFPYNTQTNSTF